MKQISDAVKADAAQLGVEVADVRIRRADLPVQVSQAINDRMKTERIREAKGYRADGEKTAQEIRATADKQATITVATAEKEAQQIKGEGDKKRRKSGTKQQVLTQNFMHFIVPLKHTVILLTRKHRWYWHRRESSSIISESL